MLTIVGYQREGHCEHCGRHLKHCIVLSDGRTVGATCFDKKLTKPKTYNGRKYRVGASHIVHLAKVRQFAAEHTWSQYGANAESFNFQPA